MKDIQLNKILRIWLRHFFNLVQGGLPLFFVFGCNTSYNNQDYPVGDQPFVDLQYSPDGNRVAAVDNTGRVYLVDSKTGQTWTQFTLPTPLGEEHNGLIAGVLHFSEDGQMLYTCTRGNNLEDSTISGWDSINPSNKQPLFQRIMRVSCSSGIAGDFLVSVDTTSHPMADSVREIKTNKKVFSTLDGEATTLALKPPYLLISFSSETTLSWLEVFNLDTKQKILSTSDYPIFHDVSPSKRQFLLQSKNRPAHELVLLDLDQNRVVQNFHVPQDDIYEIDSPVFSSDGSRIAATVWTSQHDFYWNVWDLPASDPIQTQTISDTHKLDAPVKILFVPQHNDRLITHQGGFLADQLWDANSGQKLTEFAYKPPSLPVGKGFKGLQALRVSPDGTQLIGIDTSIVGHLLVWNLSGI